MTTNVDIRVSGCKRTRSEIVTPVVQTLTINHDPVQLRFNGFAIIKRVRPADQVKRVEHSNPADLP